MDTNTLVVRVVAIALRHQAVAVLTTAICRKEPQQSKTVVRVKGVLVMFVRECYSCRMRKNKTSLHKPQYNEPKNQTNTTNYGM